MVFHWLLPTEFTLETAFPGKFLNQMKTFPWRKNTFVNAVPPKSVSCTTKFWILLHSHLYPAFAYLEY